ncbi:uncharacterized protein EAE97_002184 [Botrytis byssoidea]|uniref:Uncharacterized protein n=1 Tax=Botrytis byssoidea TaxID=139641 RepID=A0A9P5IQM5_9HELO|nr:uncharacterized protein EAE97_002184 [Botrytis byssoidea]KAF7950632.1 hypothetical protein EAE97_002184 [Botrytis byssoidea]
MEATIIQTSKVVLLELGERAIEPVLTEDGKLIKICAPFAFKLVHSAEKVTDPVTNKVTMCTESDDYIWFYECLKEMSDQKGGKKAPAIRYQDPDYISYYADMAHRPTSVRSNEIITKETLGVLYSTDSKTSAKLKLFEACTKIRIKRKKDIGYDSWISGFATQALREDIFRLAHEIRGLNVDFKLPSSTDVIVDPTKGWLYDSKRKDHLLCCPASGRPVLTEDDEFIWANDLNKRKPKPTRTVSEPVNGSTSAPKVLQRSLKSKDSDGRQTEGKRREIKPPGQDSSRDKLSSQRTSGEGTSSQGHSKPRPLRQSGSGDKLPSQSSSKTIPHKRNDSSYKSSRVVPSKQSDPRDKLHKQSDARRPLEKKAPNRKTTNEPGSTTKRPVAGRSQTFT